MRSKFDKWILAFVLLVVLGGSFASAQNSRAARAKGRVPVSSKDMTAAQMEKIPQVQQNLKMERAVGGPILSFFVGFGTGFFLMEPKFFRAWIYFSIQLGTMALGGALVGIAFKPNASTLNQLISGLGFLLIGVGSVVYLMQFVHAIIYAIAYSPGGSRKAYVGDKDERRYAFSKTKYMEKRLPQLVAPTSGNGLGLGFSRAL